MKNDLIQQLEIIYAAIKTLDMQINDMIDCSDNRTIVQTLAVVKFDLVKFKDKLQSVIDVIKVPLKCPMCSIELNESEYVNHINTHSITRGGEKNGSI